MNLCFRILGLSSKNIVFLVLVMIFTTSLKAQSVSDTQTSERIEQWLKDGIEFYRRMTSPQSVMSFYAEKQLGIPYKAGLLEKPGPESLVLTLDGSDCVIFVETTLALTLATSTGMYSIDAFERYLTHIRYRNGRINGYVSRLHYFGEWLRNGEEKGFIRVLFQDDAYPSLQPYSFMSSNRSSYPVLANDDQAFEDIKMTENILNKNLLRYIPTNRIPGVLEDLQTGDIVAFVTNIKGLDFSHTAMIKRDGDRVGFWHASTTGSVIVEPKTLYDYTKDRNSLLGIVIARPTL